MKYKVGDKVKVKRDLATDKLYWMENRSECNSVIHIMLEFRGKVAEISDIISGQYRIVGSDCLWTDEMFEGLAETEFHVYDTVKHEKYGLGTVINVSKSNIIDVDFDEKPFDRPSLKDNVLHCSPENLIVVEAYIGGEDE